MPHYTTWGGTYVTRPVAREDRSPIQSDGDFNDVVFHSKQADGFMKLGDIRGESIVAPDRADQDFVVEDNGDQVARFATSDVREHNQGSRSNWDVICDVGTFIQKTSVADALTKSGTEGYTEVKWTYLTNEGSGHDHIVQYVTGDGSDQLQLETGSVHDRITTGLGGNNFTTGAGGDSFNCDDILLGVNGTIGYEMQAGLDLRSDNRFVFEPLNAMTSFGDSIDPVLDGANGFKPREVAAVDIGQPPEPKLWLQMLG